MKKKVASVFLLLFILGSMLFVLSGCGNNESKKEADQNNENQNSESTEIPKSIYARVYGDGKGGKILILSSTDYVDNDLKSADPENYEDEGDVYNWQAECKWKSRRPKINKVIIKNRIFSFYLKCYF